jgi:hypothetical protein
MGGKVFKNIHKCNNHCFLIDALTASELFRFQFFNLLAASLTDNDLANVTSSVTQTDWSQSNDGIYI